MRIWQTLIGILLLTAMTFSVGFGATLEKDTIVLMDSVSKKTATYKICNTLVNGKELETDVPGYIVETANKQIVYVPVSTIYRSLGASVSWSEANKKLTVKYKNVTYIFSVGKSVVSVGGKSISIEDNMPVTLMKYAGVDRTMIPATFLAKTMGMELTYQPEIRTISISQPMTKINGFSYNGTAKYKEVRVAASGDVATTSYAIDGSAYGGKSKVIVEFQNALIAQGVMKSLPVSDGVVSRIDLIDPGKKPPRVRLEIETNQNTGFYSYFDKTTKEQVIQMVNTLKEIGYTKKDDCHVVTLKTSVEPEITVKKLQGKLVIDFLNTKLAYNNGSSSEKSILTAGLINVAYSQFDSKTEYKDGDMVARTVLNFADGAMQDQAYVKKTKEGVEIYLEGDPDKGVKYSKMTSATSKLEFTYKTSAQATKQFDESTRTLVLKVPKTALDLTSVYRDYRDNVIEYIDVNTSNDPDNYVITMQLAQGTVALDASNQQMLSLSFVNESIKNSHNGKKLIVLDAGHGGSDPGTIGKFTGVKEKDLALEAVYALKAELEKNGFEVLLTRSNDSRVELLQRTDLANEVNADLFISIHYNSADSVDANGIEVLYYPDDAGLKYELAKTIFTEIVKDTGATARGIVKRPLLVVTRETKMPSALIEMGFVSNRDEEIKVQNDDYLAVQVKAITQAIIIYLSNH